MPLYDLTAHVIEAAGPWMEASTQSFLAHRLELSSHDDVLVLSGPLSVRISLVARNRTLSRRSGEQLHEHALYSYTLSIPAGHEWRYVAAEHPKLTYLGANAGVVVVVEPGAADESACPPPTTDDGLPCDFGVKPTHDPGRFFPSPCEPCTPGAPVGMPPLKDPMVVPVADGGCVRPRYFNGMFITQEDLETEQIYQRLKRRMQNRAMGAGVVWGLCVGRDGRALRVEPGYGVDCCGNDIVVVNPYRVAVDTLLRDPAAGSALSNKSSRMHLLLEYVECPDTPRPVHADPCSPDVARCEMSRVRETARLRLVPPRDYAPRGPIDAFLEVVDSLDDGDESPAPATSEPPAVEVPLDLTVAVAGRASRTVALPEGRVDVLFDDMDITQTGVRVGLVVRGRSPRILAAGSLVEIVDEGGGTRVLDRLESPFDLQLDASEQLVPGPNLSGRTYRFEVRQWRAGELMANDGDWMFAGTTRIDVTVSPGDPIEGIGARVIVAATSTARVERIDLGPWHCATQPCGDRQRPLFPVVPPFLHQDPLHPGVPADPGVWLLAVLYMWAANEQERHRVGSNDATWTRWLAFSLLLYYLATAGLTRARTREQLQRVTEALRTLLRDWCKGMLYPGPHCDQKPHGIVLGCARVSGGDIVGVDVWDGRRHVVHYPLLAHWGEQLGIAAPDVTFGRMMSFLCCTSSLPAPVFPADEKRLASSVIGVPMADTTSGIRAGAASVGAVPAGAGFLAVGDTDSLRSRLGAAGVPVATGAARLSPIEFAMRVASTLRASAAPGAALTSVRLGDTPLHLFVPAAGAQPVQPVAVDGRLREVAVERLPDRGTAVQPLLRGVAADLTAELLRAMPVADDAGDPAVVGALRAANVATVGAVLDRAPDRLHADVLRGENAAGLSALVEDSERAATNVGRAVSDTLRRFAEENNVAAPGELANEEREAALAKELATRLARGRVSVADDAVRAAVTRAIRGQP